MRDPYHILGLKPDAPSDEVKQAYRRLVKEVHPDLHPGDPAMEQRFKDVAAAYALLGDPDKRARFDRGQIDADGRPMTKGWRTWRHSQPAGSASSASPGPGNSSAGGSNAESAGGKTGAKRGFADFFRRAPRMAGKDVHYELTVPFVDAAVGGKQRLTLSDGRVITVAVPAGAATGQVLRLKGQGLKGMGGGKAGDALVALTVAPHSHFQRDGTTVHLHLPITLKEAICGATVDTPTVHGRVALKIPAGSATGRVLRLRGKGIVDRATDEWGDQLVTLELVLPESPDPALKALIAGWNPPASYDPRGDAGF